MVELVGSFSGELVRSPFPTSVSIAELKVLPLYSTADLESISRFKSHQVPVYLNVREHYQLLVLLVERVLKINCELVILIRFSMPGGVQIPNELLHSNVLILQDIKVEKKCLIQENKAVLVIDDNFAHFEIDNGDNLISLELFSENTHAHELMNELIDVLALHGVVDV